MKVLFVVASLNPEWGGPVQVIKHTTEHLVKMGVDVTIFSPLVNSEKNKIIFPDGVNVRLFKRSLFSVLWTGFSFSLIKRLKKEIINFDIVHIHEIWHFPHFLASRLSLKNDIPFVITVHGALSPFALQIKSIKKRVFGNLFEKNFFRRAAGIQAITKTEIEQIKKFEPGSKTELIFNGIPEMDVRFKKGKNELSDIYPGSRDKRVILFMGRIDRIKGLDLLVESFRVISSEFDDILLMIAGPDFGYKKTLMKKVVEKKIEDKVIFTGTLSGKLKSDALNNSEIFVLPSYSEAFSIAVLEAISRKLPVIITHKCNFPEIKDINAGILIDPDSYSMTEALRSILHEKNYKSNIGEEGRAFVLNNYTWEKIVSGLLNWYKSIKHNEKNRSQQI